MRSKRLPADGKPIFFPPQKRRLSEAIFDQLKEAILSGHYKPGERLPSEKALCETFQVGRAVIREGLRALENQGLIYIRVGSTGGVFVKAIEAATLANTLEGIVRLNQVSIGELIAARTAIESCIFRMVIRNLKDGDLDKLQASIEEARTALEQGVEEPRNALFHSILADITGNRLLKGITEGMLELQRKFVFLSGYSYERKKRFLEEHQRVLDFLKTGRYKEATEAYEAHIRDSENLFVPRQPT